VALKTLTSARTAIESARGTAVTCTRLLYAGEMSWEQEVGTVMPTELRNSYFKSFRGYQGHERNSFKFSGDAVFDDLAFWGSAAIKGGLSGSGGSADKTWTFTPSAATDDLKSFTLEAAYTDLLSSLGWRWPGVMVDEFTLSFEKSEPIKWSASCLTHKAAVQITAFTGSLSDRTLVTALGSATAVPVDTTTIGSTPDTNIVKAEFSLKNDFTELMTLDGTTAGQALYRPKPRETQLKLTRYLANKTELDAYIAKTARKVRITTTGPALGGTNYKIQLDFYGIPTDHKYADVDGLITEEITLDGVYDTGASTDFSLVVVNSLAAIT